ncbi:MAG: chromate transporter, partial [Sphingobacteriales bacterium]
LVLFIVPFWNDLKKITRIKRSLSGINAVSVGFIIAAFLLLLQPIVLDWLSIVVMLVTFAALNFTRINAPLLIIAGVLLGYLI